jgi:hypothetical protein
VKAKARNRKKSDLDDSNAQRFFAEGEARSQAEVDPSEFGLPSEGQSGFKRNVYIVVGLCVVVIVLVLIRSALAPPPPLQTHSEPAPSVAAPAIPPPPPEPVVAAPQPAASTPSQAAAPVASAAASAAPAASGVAVPADSSVAAVASSAPASTKTEAQERDDARRLLARGKATAAADAAARATALDPTDGDAWLLLGAADMEIGKTADAREAFTQCVKQGKRGEIGECRSMLH